MALLVLELFKRNHIVAYALQAHMSGKTQPLDVIAFSAFQRKLNSAIASLVHTKTNDAEDVYEVCAVLKNAYYIAFTHSNIDTNLQTRQGRLAHFHLERLVS